jgi:hypothetical protein
MTQFRRVVTGHDEHGRSCFITDGPSPHIRCRSPGSTIVHEMWRTSGSPADNSGSAETALGPYSLTPAEGGSAFRVIVYPPDTQRLAALARERSEAHDDGSGRAKALDKGSPRHPGFHKTDTIDYAIVLKGEIWALMEEGETLLKAGDVLVQRGTNHAWSNRTEEPAVLAFVLIDAKAAP